MSEKLAKLLEELDSLKLPEDQYVIVGSGPIGVRGIREIGDLDILPTPILWQELAKKYPVKYKDPIDEIEIGDISILGEGSMFKDDSVATLEEQIQTADILEGHRFLNLELLKKFKQKKVEKKI